MCLARFSRPFKKNQDETKQEIPVSTRILKKAPLVVFDLALFAIFMSRINMSLISQDRIGHLIPRGYKEKLNRLREDHEQAISKAAEVVKARANYLSVLTELGSLTELITSTTEWSTEVSGVEVELEDQVAESGTDDEILYNLRVGVVNAIRVLLVSSNLIKDQATALEALEDELKKSDRILSTQEYASNIRGRSAAELLELCTESKEEKKEKAALAARKAAAAEHRASRSPVSNAARSRSASAGTQAVASPSPWTLPLPSPSGTESEEPLGESSLTVGWGGGALNVVTTHASGAAPTMFE